MCICKCMCVCGVLRYVPLLLRCRRRFCYWPVLWPASARVDAGAPVLPGVRCWLWWGWNVGVEHGLGTQALPSLAQSTSPKTCREGTRSLRIRVRNWTRACSLTFMVHRPELNDDLLRVRRNQQAPPRLRCWAEVCDLGSASVRLVRQNGRKGTTKGPGGQRE